MNIHDPASLEVKHVIDALIQTATNYDIEALKSIYHEQLDVLMIDDSGSVNTADKSTFINLFKSKRDAGDPPMNTWAKFHSVNVAGKHAHVALTRKNNLSGQDMILSLSIDLIYEQERWQVSREVIFIRPEHLTKH